MKYFWNSCFLKTRRRVLFISKKKLVALKYKGSNRLSHWMRTTYFESFHNEKTHNYVVRNVWENVTGIGKDLCCG